MSLYFIKHHVSECKAKKKQRQATNKKPNMYLDIFNKNYLIYEIVASVCVLERVYLRNYTFCRTTKARFGISRSQRWSCRAGPVELVL